MENITESFPKFEDCIRKELKSGTCSAVNSNSLEIKSSSRIITIEAIKRFTRKFKEYYEINYSIDKPVDIILSEKLIEIPSLVKLSIKSYAFIIRTENYEYLIFDKSNVNGYELRETVADYLDNSSHNRYISCNKTTSCYNNDGYRIIADEPIIVINLSQKRSNNDIIRIIGEQF